MSGIPGHDRADVQAIAPAPESPSHAPALSPWRQLRLWLNVGIQSFGGGTATLYLIRRTAVERHRWLTAEEFARYWGICQIAPGINLLGLVILIGWRIAGAAGVALALAGLLLPSAAITIALTAVYSSVEQLPLVRAVLRGVVPATVGLGLLLSYTMARPLLAAGRREGHASLTLAWALLIGSGLVVALTRTPVVAVLWGAGALAALAQWQRVARQGRAR
jgi:chromate transporter